MSIIQFAFTREGFEYGEGPGQVDGKFHPAVLYRRLVNPWQRVPAEVEAELEAEAKAKIIRLMSR